MFVQAMANVRLVIAVLVPDAAHAMQDMCQMPPQDYVLVVLPTPTLHLLAIWHVPHVCVKTKIAMYLCFVMQSLH